jgi:hypothetical protein
MQCDTCNGISPHMILLDFDVKCVYFMCECCSTINYKFTYVNKIVKKHDLIKIMMGEK